MDVRNLEKRLENPKEKINLLFVCGANKGRSAVAHSFIQQLINKKFNIHRINVKSGGIKKKAFYDRMSKKGEFGVPNEIRDIAKERYRANETIENHIAQPVNLNMLEWADLVLTFDTNVRNYLINKVESSVDVNKIQTIKGYITGNEGLNWKNNDTDDAQKFEGIYRQYCPFFKENGTVDMKKIWVDTRYTDSSMAIYTVFSDMFMESTNLAYQACLDIELKLKLGKSILV